MGYSYTIIPEDNCVRNRITDPFTFDDYKNLMEEILSDKNFTTSMNMFWDFRMGSLSKFSNQDIEGIKNYIYKNKKRRGENYRVAFLVNKTIDFGLSRMYQIISEDLPVEMEIFTDENLALEWINNENCDS